MHRKGFMGVLACAMALQLVACSRQSAEDKAKEMATEKVDMAKGLGDVLQEKGTAAAESVTTGVGKVLRGVERGIEKSGRTVTLSESARQAGLQATKVQLMGQPTVAEDAVSGASQPASAAGHGIEIYLVTERDLTGQLKVRVFNSLDQEIGRTRMPFKQGADQGQYLSIPLAAQLDLSSITRVDIDYLAEPSGR